MLQLRTYVNISSMNGYLSAMLLIVTKDFVCLKLYMSTLGYVTVYFFKDCASLGRALHCCFFFYLAMHEYVCC